MKPADAETFRRAALEQLRENPEASALVNGATSDGMPEEASSSPEVPPPAPSEQQPPVKSRPKKGLDSVDGLSVYNAIFDDTTAVVEGLLFPGVTLFAGRPKVGKSWFVLELALAVAKGSRFLNRFEIESPGRVVYCALEEPKRRTTGRLKKLMPEPDIILQNVHFIYRMPKLQAGGAAELDSYLSANPAQLVVIDTLLAVVEASGKRDVLRSDYAEVELLRKLAEKHNTAILVVAHLRKAKADNGVDAVAGTTGMTAACDAVWTIEKQPTGDFVLEIIGREMEEKKFGMQFRSGEITGWQITGEGAEVGMSVKRAEIMQLLKDEGPLTPVKIASLLRKNAVTVRRLIQKLVKDGFVEKNSEDKYALSIYREQCEREKE